MAPGCLIFLITGSRGSSCATFSKMTPSTIPELEIRWTAFGPSASVTMRMS